MATQRLLGIITPKIGQDFVISYLYNSYFSKWVETTNQIYNLEHFLRNVLPTLRCLAEVLFSLGLHRRYSTFPARCLERAYFDNKHIDSWEQFLTYVKVIHTHTLYIYDYICNYRCILYFIFVYIYLPYIYFIYIYILYIHVISIFITACTKTCIQYTDIRPCHFNTYVKTKEMTSIRVFVGGNCSNRLIFQGLWHYQLCWCSRRQGTSDPSVGERPWNWILGALPLW